MHFVVKPVCFMLEPTRVARPRPCSLFPVKEIGQEATALFVLLVGPSSTPTPQLHYAGMWSWVTGQADFKCPAAADIGDWHLILPQSKENRRQLDFGTESQCWMWG